MKIYERLKNNFIDKDYFISISSNYVYILNYKSIASFDSSKIKINFENFGLSIKGNNFKITRKNKVEIEISGSFSKMEIINEI